MIDYTGINCPVCSKTFLENDDVVVCPKCGAPYHRDCYVENGECIFTQLHEKNENWEPPKPEKPVNTHTYEIKDQECKFCGVLNAHSALFCSNCSKSLSGAPEQHNNSGYKTSFSTGDPYTAPHAYSPGATFPFDPMANVDLTDKMTETITYGEASKVVQQNLSYYLPVFKRIKDRNKGKFNFYAFLFSGPWLLYRKQYKSGIIFTVAMFVLYLAQTFLTLNVSIPKLYSLLSANGIQLTTQGLTSEQMLILAQSITGQDLLILTLPFFMLVAMFVIMLIIGFRGNRMYMKHCANVISKTREVSVNIEDYNTNIMEKGGVNTSITVCIAVCALISYYLPYMLY